MKKTVNVLIVFSIFLFLTMGTVLAANETELTEQDRVDKAYSCLNEKIEEKDCDNMALQEKIFSVLSVGKCKNELMDDSKSDECWPKARCDLKSTAQAALALDRVGKDTDDAVDWLLDQKMVPQDLMWFLQIENEGEANCKIGYDGREYSVSIKEDKTISGNPGSCFNLAETSYWLSIVPNCYEKEFSISCDKDFKTSLLFKKRTDKTIHVINKVDSRPEGATSIQKINSFCFGERGVCNYEGSLWSTLVLGVLGEDISPYVPYLITGAKTNEASLPSSILYMITNEEEYRTRILELQINSQYWKASTDRFYDTALALLPFQLEELTEKDNAKEWLFDIQGEEGCWDGGNIRSNGFILYSIWPKMFDNDGEESTNPDNDCLLSNAYCVVASSCEGTLMEDYFCAGSKKCCSTQTEQKTCTILGGEICSSGEYCEGGTKLTTIDLVYGEKCCLGGTCKESSSLPPSEETSEYTCEDNWGTCSDFCGSGEKESSTYTCSGTQVCCVEDKAKMSPSFAKYWWIWVLFLLIVLAVVGIIYREKIKEYLNKNKKKPEEKDEVKKPMFPSYHRAAPINVPQRKIIPRETPQITRRPQIKPKPKSPKELDEVLKKLKEMSK